MARVVCVHGIAQQYESAETLLARWAPALRGGVGLAGGALAPEDIGMAFYGVVFRPSGKGDAIPDFAPGDVEDPLEIELLQAWVHGADAEQDSEVALKGFKGTRGVAAMLQAVARTPFFGDVALRAVIWHLKQVRRYLTDPEIRQRTRQAILNSVSDDTRVLVGHSLGSVVAYETLCAQPELPVRTLVTLGSPLGVGPLGRRLEPPVARGSGVWPRGIRQWFNIADRADVVAVEKALGVFFGPDVVDRLVQNGATAHDAQPYLTAVETGDAINAGLCRA